MNNFLPLHRLLLAAGLSVSISTQAGDWPQWRGPDRDGRVQEGTFPRTLGDNHLKQSWRVELGPSYSGPIIAAGKVFVTESKDKKHEAVLALDATTGRQIWRTEWEGSMSVPFFARANGSWIRSTPAYDGGKLYVAGMRDVLVCLDAETGREIWRYDFPKELKTSLPDFGFVCSPLVDTDGLYVQAGGGFAKLDKRTGKLLWRVLVDGGGMWGSAFSSPVITTLGGRRQLVVQTRKELAGVLPEDGSVLWTQPVEAFRGMNILTPVVHSNMVFTSTYGGKSIGHEVTRKQDRYEVTPMWTHKAQGYMSTPVIIDGVAYHHLRSERMTAIELATGRELWTSSESFGKYMNFVFQGDRILGLDQRGKLHLIQANKEKLELISSRKVAEEETWAHLGMAEGQLYIRDLKGLTAFQVVPSQLTSSQPETAR